MHKLLLLEDDLSLTDGLCYSLGKNDFAVKAVRTVKDAKAALGGKDSYDLLLLDVALPDGTGFEVCESVRKSGNMVPIIFLTAADEETSIVRGLDGGGDDYITKPFRLSELCSRIRALLRRSGMEKTEKEGRLCSGPVQIDLIDHRVYREGCLLELTGSEYRLLCLLLKNADRILTRGAILDALWDGNGNFVDDNTLSVYIRRLREKIEEEPSNPKHLLTVRGFGYQWKE